MRRTNSPAFVRKMPSLNIQLQCKEMASFSFTFFILLFTTFLNTLSCTKSPTEPNGNKLLLTLEDVSCTEAWIRVQVGSSSSSGSNVVIKRNDKVVFDFKLTTNDTTIIDDSLLPKQTYKYQAILTENGKITSASTELIVTTMDTTSHNFTWQTFTFGRHSSSVLYDVAIINENNI